jgi:hypothetical protein
MSKRRFQNLMGGLLDGEPLRLPLPLFPPRLELLGNLEGIHFDAA